VVPFKNGIEIDLDIKHQATASKDRTGLFSNPMPFTITEQTGSRIRVWCLGEDLIKQGCILFSVILRSSIST
jgi:hypothetical protein